MLAVYVNQLFANFAQLRDCDNRAIDVGSTAALRVNDATGDLSVAGLLD